MVDLWYPILLFKKGHSSVQVPEGYWGMTAFLYCRISFSNLALIAPVLVDPVRSLFSAEVVCSSGVGWLSDAAPISHANPG